MRIKTITCHDVYNAGASLQAYALSTYLKELGHEVEIIDYKPAYLCRHYPLFGVANPAFDRPVFREVYNLLKLPARIRDRLSRRKKEFDIFTHELLPLTGTRYTSNEQLKKELPAADVFFAGSDQIWNCFFQNGKDPAFYLDFVPDTLVKASYAASFAQESIPDEQQAKLCEWINRLDAVSVREKSGLRILEDIGVKGGCCVLDPVFLIERSRWELLAEKKSFDEPYIFFYDFDCNEELGKSVKNYAKNRGLKIYSYLPNHFCDKSFHDYGPLMFLGLIMNAELVVSNSFHATAFALLFEKQFIVAKRSEPINTRMIDLLAIGDLESCLIEAPYFIQEPRIDYNMVANKLSGEIQNSKAYIDMVIEKAKVK